VQENKIYKIAKEISISESDELNNKLIISLSEHISEHFEKNDSQYIENAIMQSVQEENAVITNIIMDEIHFDIENVFFEDEKGNEFDSTMYVMPCVVLNRTYDVLFPSISNVESIICKHFIKNGIIENKTQFRLGTIRISQGKFDEMSLQDWWNTHRDIIDDDENGDFSSENKQIRELTNKIQMDKVISVFYFVPIIVNTDDNGDIVENIYESYIHVDMWNSIGSEISDISDNDSKFTFFPPMPIAESTDNIKKIMQSLEFDLFFNQYAYMDSIEIAYAKISDSPFNYAILFFDGEDQTLVQFYKYDTDDDTLSFIATLIEKCIENPVRTLHFLEKEIELKKLVEWSNAKQSIDLSYYLNGSNEIDLIEAYRMYSLNNPYIDSFLNKTILH